MKAPSARRLIFETGRRTPLALVQPQTGHVEAVPRHVEIPERLAEKIYRAMIEATDPGKR